MSAINDINRRINRFVAAVAMAGGVGFLAGGLLASKINDDQFLSQAFTRAVNAQAQAWVQKQITPALSTASYWSNAPRLEFTAASGTVNLDQARAEARDKLAEEESARHAAEGFGAVMMFLSGGGFLANRKKPAPSGPAPV